MVLATAVMACGGGNEKPPLTPDTVEPETGADAGATTPSPVAPSSSAAPATGTTPAK
ncbi:hypothetical protein AKJ09_06309 [Labilithrix luteola]|uniref:Uncharacterized protein n=1 Tax=Labilithrix luteola TaxID=1391654 RepID=A0A0K1Q1H6_9BACT|nr:hypothetical protein AKJ09_06309 [Labilithrix luteola]